MSLAPSPASAPTGMSNSTGQPDWGAIGERLVAAFPEYPVREVLTELVNAHDSALYVGTTEPDLAEVVEVMATYAMKVRAGLISPSGRIAPETRSSG